MEPRDLKKLAKGAKVLIPQAEAEVSDAYGEKIVATVVSVLEEGKKGSFKPAKAYWTAREAAQVTAAGPPDAEDFSAFLEALQENSSPPRESSLTRINQRDEVELPSEKVKPYTWEYSNVELYEASTEYDRLAAQDPMAFLSNQSQYSWDRVRKLYADGFLSHPDGGMQALLDYRRWKVDQLLDALRPYALEMAKLQRSKAITWRDVQLPDVTTDQKLQFLAAARAPGGDAPGSTEPTSDIDLNTFNQGTEFLVKAFNDLFGLAHDGHEAGIVFDVNVYGKDFLPNLKAIKGKKEPTDPKQKGAPLFVLPERDHVFKSREIEYRDANEQLKAGLLKVRRYMAPRTIVDASNRQEWLGGSEWSEFKLALEERRRQLPERPENGSGELGKVVDAFPAVEEEFQANQRLLATMVTWIQARGKPTHESSRQQVLSSLQALQGGQEPELPTLSAGSVEDLNALMAAENRIYEVRLDEVAKLRAAFDLEKFIETGSNAGEVDRAYLALRTAGSGALYFANEAYVTSGAVTQVVGGKQKVSGGVTSARDDGDAKANIAYGAHELVHSMLDQLSDIYKETKRHYLHGEGHATTEEKKRDLLGEAILKSSKYFHRMFNAIKHLYLIIGIVEARESDGATGKSGDGLRNYIWGEAFKRRPTGAFEDLARFVAFQKLGFALEALKKFKLDLSDQKSRDSLKTLLQKRFSLQEKPQVYGRPPEISTDFLNPAEKVLKRISERQASKEWIAASAVETYFRKCLSYPDLAPEPHGWEKGYWRIGNIREALTRLVVTVLADYGELAARDDEVISNAMRAAQRPYPRLNPVNYYGNVAS